MNVQNLITTCCAVSLLIFVGLACKNNPLTKYTKQYHCTIEGEPEPQTAEDYFNRARKHIEIFSGDGATSLDDCAIDALSEALRLEPNYTDALRLRGYGYKQKKQYDPALADYDKAIQIEPNDENSFRMRSRVYEDKGSFDKAVEDQTTVINLLLKNNSADTKKLVEEYNRKADLHEKNDDFENAVKDYTEIIKLKPDSTLAIYLRAKAFEKKGDYESAVQDYTELIRLDDDPNNYYLRSEVYKKLGETSLAEADMKKFNELNSAKNGKTSNLPTNQSTNNSNIPKTISGGVINGKATDLPKPVYPAAARAVRASGAVNVQVTVDEKGDVISASAVSGHPLLRASAVAAAKNAKFNPTLLSGKPVKFSGVIVYNFTL